MDSLFTDDELNEALHYAGFLYETGVDAMMIRDMGLGKLISEYMADFPLYLLPQATVYDRRGVEAAARLGYERVSLASELSMAEIKEIAANTDVETEVFVHGSLCICYGGQCQLSRYYGDKSSNRGTCDHGCRLPYMTFDDKGKPLDTISYPLSPKDQCLIDYLGQLVDAGVTSLRIEGLAKSPEYVAEVTAIYRKYLDLYYENGGYIVEEGDRLRLMQIFSRGAFTDEYIRGRSGMELMSGDMAKHQGIRIGKVIKKVQGTALVDVKLYENLHIGDEVEIHGKDLAKSTVTYYKELKSGLSRIGDIKGRVSHGDPLFRLSSKEQLERARATYERVDMKQGKYLRKTAVDMKVIVSGSRMKLVVYSKDGISASVESGMLDHAGANATSMERIESSLRKTGNTPFEVVNISFDGEFNFGIKSSEINEMRREALTLLEDNMITRREKPGIFEYVPLKEERPLEAVELFCYDFDTYKSQFIPEEVENLHVPKVFVIPAVDFHRHHDELLKGTFVTPYISNMPRGSEDRYIEEHFDEIVELCQDTGIYVGNLSWIQPFRAAGVHVYGDYGLNIFNEQAQAAMDALGVRRCIDCLETADDYSGQYPLMTMAHELIGAYILNKGKPHLSVVRPDFSDQTFLVPERKSYVDHKDTLTKDVMRIYLG
jgi:putative protease